MEKFLETERLILRKMLQSDYEDLCKILQDEDVMYAYEGAFNDEEVQEVFSIIRDTNSASQNVAKRNGMVCTDRFVKHYRGVDMPHYVFSVRRGTD